MNGIPFFPEVKKNFGFGCMRLPMKDGEVDLDQFCEMADLFIDAGFNYFDTAHGYIRGKSETAVRDCVAARYPREKFLLTNKLTGPFFNSREDIIPLFESQLRACGVEYFDFYLMHAQTAAVYPKFRECEAYETAFRLREEGRVRHVGLSFHDDAELLDRILRDYPDLEAVQIQLNYLDYYDPVVQSKPLLDVCAAHGKPVIVMEPVKGGSLVKLPADAEAALDRVRNGCSNAGIALRFAAGCPGVFMTLSGMSDLAQTADNVSTMKDFRPLSPEEEAAVISVREIFSKQNLISCTGCRYCVDGCPAGIKIPELFACLNARNVFGSWNQNMYYSIATRDGGRASDCLACGQCEDACPQHLPVRDLLGKVAEVFDKK